MNIKSIFKKKNKEQEEFEFKKKKGITLMEKSILAIIVAIIIVVINFIFFSNSPQLFAVLNLIGIVMALAIPLYTKYSKYSKTKKIEAMFPHFLRDVTDNIQAGMTLPQAFRAAAENDYDIMSPYVKELSAKIDWGISFHKALNGFSNKTNSKVVKRTVKSIIEVHNYGGSISTVLEAISSAVFELERIKKERATSVYGPMVTGYFIFFLFLGIMFIMAKVLIPAFTWEGMEGAENLKPFFAMMFRNMAVIQGVFAGLGLGKMAEGSITAGFKHAFVMGIVGYTVFIVA